MDNQKNFVEKIVNKKIIWLVVGIVSLVLLATSILFSTGIFSNVASSLPKPESKKAAPERTILDYSSDELSNLAVGDVFYLGKYEQDDDLENGTEDLAWIILSKEGNQITAITRDLIDSKPYDANGTIFWEDSTLRQWLNNDFYNSAFSSGEQAAIQTYKSITKKREFEQTPFEIVEVEVEDKVFLLNSTEVKSLFASKKARIAEPTDYTVSQMKPSLYVTHEKKDADGNVVSTQDGSDQEYKDYAIEISTWWLRKDGIEESSGFFNMTVDGVDHDGNISEAGLPGLEHICVRPAIVIVVGGGAASASNQETTTEAETTTQQETTTEFIGGGPHAPDVMVSTVDELMLRTGPGTNYQAIAKLSKGDEFYVFESQNGWAHGTYNGLDGWASEQYLTKNGAAVGDYSAYEDAVRQFDPMHIGNSGIGPYTIELRGEDSNYAYYQAYAGGGWECVKVSKTYPYPVEYMNASERAMYEQSPYN